MLTAAVKRHAVEAFRIPGGSMEPTILAGDYLVPAGHVFLLGDARDNSVDGRHHGFTAERAITGRPSWVYFSRDPESGAVRWRRIGRRIERARAAATR